MDKHEFKEKLKEIYVGEGWDLYDESSNRLEFIRGDDGIRFVYYGDQDDLYKWLMSAASAPSCPKLWMKEPQYIDPYKPIGNLGVCSPFPDLDTKSFFCNKNAKYWYREDHEKVSSNYKEGLAALGTQSATDSSGRKWYPEEHDQCAGVSEMLGKLSILEEVFDDFGRTWYREDHEKLTPPRWANRLADNEDGEARDAIERKWYREDCLPVQATITADTTALKEALERLDIDELADRNTERLLNRHLTGHDKPHERMTVEDVLISLDSRMDDMIDAAKSGYERGLKRDEVYKDILEAIDCLAGDLALKQDAAMDGNLTRIQDDLFKIMRKLEFSEKDKPFTEPITEVLRRHGLPEEFEVYEMDDRSTWTHQGHVKISAKGTLKRLKPEAVMKVRNSFWMDLKLIAPLLKRHALLERAFGAQLDAQEKTKPRFRDKAKNAFYKAGWLAAAAQGIGTVMGVL